MPGGGGASTGIEIATGRSVDIAINHDPKAIAQHRANHPSTKHYCESVWDVDPVKACGGHPAALVRSNLPELCKAVRLPICRPDRMQQEENGQLRFA